jgi:hypothetical protein
MFKMPAVKKEMSGSSNEIRLDDDDLNFNRASMDSKPFSLSSSTSMPVAANINILPTIAARPECVKEVVPKSLSNSNVNCFGY